MAAVKFFISKKTWSKMVKHTCCGYSARFLTYVWPFFSVMKEKVKGLVMVARVLDARLLHSSHKNKAIRIHKYVCEASIRCKIQSFEEWLVEVNDASSPITQFQESELLSELTRNSMQRSLHTLKNLRKKFLGFMNILRIRFKVSLALLHHTGTPIWIWCKHCLTNRNHLGQLTGTCIYVPLKKSYLCSMTMTITIMQGIW